MLVQVPGKGEAFLADRAAVRLLHCVGQRVSFERGNRGEGLCAVRTLMNGGGWIRRGLYLWTRWCRYLLVHFEHLPEEDSLKEIDDYSLCGLLYD